MKVDSCQTRHKNVVYPGPQLLIALRREAAQEYSLWFQPQVRSSTGVIQAPNERRSNLTVRKKSFQGSVSNPFVCDHPINVIVRSTAGILRPYQG